MSNRNACEEYRQLSRRGFLQGATGVLAAGFIAPSWLPRVVMAQSQQSRDVIVSIYLRGGCDGLTMCVPFGDANYYTLRNQTAVARPDANTTNRATDLDGYFGLTPAMTPLKAIYDAGDLLVVHATGSRRGSRSHFDEQYFMEVGDPAGINLGSGWLGRHLATTNPVVATAAMRALSFSFGTAQTMRGGPKTLPIPDPTNYNIQGQTATRTDRRNALLANFNADDLMRQSAQETYAVIDLLQTIGFSTYAPAGGALYPTGGFGDALRRSAALIRKEVGVEALHIDLGGWDTHSQQGVFTGTMQRNMQSFAQGLLAFYTDLNAAGFNNRVTTVVISEFGRTAKENGSAGTDHGFGNAAFLIGGKVLGGRVYTNGWPGLASGQLYQGRDLNITTDYRDILAEIVQKRLGNGQNLSTVFPNYTPTMRGLVEAG